MTPPEKEQRARQRRLDPLEELRASTEAWLSQFNIAFALMSIIPLLICCYLITVKFFSLSILAGINGMYFLFAVILALLGLLAGRQVIRTVIRRLLDANERMDRFQTMQSEFVHHVAHEFRSPLAIIKGALDNLRDGLYGTLTSEQVEPLTMSNREVARLRRVVGDLLDIGQIESGKLALHRELLVLQEVLRDVTQACQALSTERGLALELQAPEQPIRVHADRDRLSQVFLNLVTNAIKFTPRGGVQVRLTRNGAATQVEVADSGRGIAREDLGRLFVKFERVGAGDQEGSGLGLAIAKAIVELHDGRIWVESESNRGSHFFVRLPAEG